MNQALRRAPAKLSSLGDNLAHVRTSALSSANGRLVFWPTRALHYLGGFQGGRLRCLSRYIPIGGPKLSPNGLLQRASSLWRKRRMALRRWRAAGWRAAGSLSPVCR